MKFRNLIVPVDFSEGSRLAVARAVMMSGEDGVPIHLVHGVEEVRYTGQFQVPHEFRNEIRDAATAELKRWAEELGGVAATATQTVTFGHPAKVICKEAARYEQALIVMGTHGYSGIQRAVMGSIAERTVRLAPCPVLTVRGTAEDAGQPFRRVVACTDFSPDADFAVECAMGLSQKFGAELHLVHALHLSQPTLPDLMLPESYFIEDARKVAGERIALAFERVKAAGLDGAPHVVEGVASRAIAEFSKTLRSDLIVIGTRGLTGVQHLISLGSVAERVLRSADCSVLAVKLPDEEKGNRREDG